MKISDSQPNHFYLVDDELILCEIPSSYITLTRESSDGVDGHSTILLSVGVRAQHPTAAARGPR